MDIQEAVYKEQTVRNFKDNPMIMALPRIPNKEEMIRNLICYPDYSESERYNDLETRLYSLSNINSVYQPVNTSLEIFRKIDFVIRGGYSSRNPFSKAYINDVYKDFDKIWTGVNLDLPIKNSISFALFGSSGCGKTTAIEKVSNYYRPIIHKEFKGVMFNCYSIPMIIVSCQHDASIKGLLQNIFYEVDQAIGSNYFEKSIRARNTTDVLIIRAKQLLRSVNCGCLIIDEIQNLSIHKSGGKEKILNTLLILSSIGMPIIFVGTAKAIEMFSSSGFRLSRRLVDGGGGILIDRFKNDASWELFLRSIWKYQYTAVKNELTPELVNFFYTITAGIPSLLKSIYIAVQKTAIKSKNEVIDKDLIIKVFNHDFKLMIPMITAFSSNNLQKMIQYDDMYIEGLIENKLFLNNKSSLTRNKKDLNTKVIKETEKIKFENYHPKFKTNYSQNDIRSHIAKKGEGESNYDVLLRLGLIAKNDLETIGEKT
ncbi:ATP-binding protein [Petrocella sp. FN5]|uniref:ATP-binding protein n=1 Tax=Petrocella sp. FN5 TaxID=3032002 RepID=UPI0023D97980|nr:AAA family ATPase [Petrocella sp. FN5]MDF1617311.1 AAA family ATPase [Petrocella sp. FN5]